MGGTEWYNLLNYSMKQRLLKIKSLMINLFKSLKNKTPFKTQIPKNNNNNNNKMKMKIIKITIIVLKLLAKSKKKINFCMLLNKITPKLTNQNQ